MFQFPEGQPSSIAEVGALRSGIRSRRNGAIDFLRFVFACAIVLYHYRRDVFPGGYIAVEFFFIVTGYLAAREAAQSDQRTMGAAARFLRHKLSLFYPAFLIAYAFAFIITQVLKQSAFAEWVRQLALSFWNFLLLRMSGVSMGFAGGGEWYLSAMMLALLLIYPLLLTHRKGFTLVVAPVFCFSLLWMEHARNSGNCKYVGLDRIVSGWALPCCCRDLAGMHLLCSLLQAESRRVQHPWEGIAFGA